MSYPKKKLGIELKNEISKGYDIVRISRWAHGIFLNNIRDLTPDVREILQLLFRMEDDPCFEFSKKELEMLAKGLIEGSKDPLLFYRKALKEMRRENKSRDQV